MESERLGDIYLDMIYRAEFEALSKAQKNAVEASDILYRSFYANDSGKKVYPKNYAGAHIEDNILYIHIVDLDTQDITPYQTLLSNYIDDIAFVDAKHSLETLISTGRELFFELAKHNVDVISYGVSETTNSITIGIREDSASTISYATIDAAQKTCSELQSASEDWNVPVQISSQPIPVACVDIMGGTRLESYTVGVCGTYMGNPAFALCGHGLEQNELIYTQTTSDQRDTLVGTVAVAHFESGEAGDYAIVTPTPGTTATSYYAGNPSGNRYTITDTVDCPSEGTYVAKYGSRGNFAYGITRAKDYIESIYIPYDYQMPIDGQYIYELIKVDLIQGVVRYGDSGGPVIATDGESNRGAFCGTVSGMLVDEGTNYATEMFYFSPYEFLAAAGFSANTAE